MSVNRIAKEELFQELSAIHKQLEELEQKLEFSLNDINPNWHVQNNDKLSRCSDKMNELEKAVSQSEQKTENDLSDKKSTKRMTLELGF